jgi:uncharacterized protein YeeX (DUF496 family)
MNATQNNQNGMTELIISVIEPVKRRGRPTGSKNRPYYQTDFTVHKTEVKPKKKLGRPSQYGPRDNNGVLLLNNLSTYQNRGFLINKILGFKKNYKLSFPDKADYIGKSNEAVIDILKLMAVEVQKIKGERLLRQIENLPKYISS